MLAEKYHYPKFVCEQPPYNLLDRRIENEIMPMCQTYDLGILAWGPLAHGVLAGRYKDASDLPEGSRGTLRPVYGERITQEGIDVGKEFAKKAKDKDYFNWAKDKGMDPSGGWKKSRNSRGRSQAGASSMRFRQVRMM